MSNTAQVEPTEEQRQAAAAFVARHGEQNEVIDSGGQARLEWSPTHTADDIARLLAEREAKLQARIDDLTERSARRLDDSTAIDALVYAIACLELQPGSERDRAVRDALNRVINHVGAIEVRARDSATKVVGTLVAGAKAREDALTARVAELEAKIADGVFSCPGCGRHDFGFFASQIKAACGPCRTRAENAEARVTELEAACGERLAKLGEAYEEAETGWLGDIKELEEREAQHLADINALHQFLGDHEEEEGIWIPRSEFKDVPCRKYLAHYDDAKADAPAVSPDCPRESPECITVGFHAVDECERRTSSFPSKCPKCQEGTHPFYDVEQDRWLCDRCHHHPAGEPFAHDTEGGEGFEDANINNQKTIKALNEENQRYCEQVAIEKRHWSNLNKHNEKTEAEAATLRARVVELEEIESDLRGDIESDVEKHKREVEALTKRVAELEERERFRDLAAEVDTGEPADSILIRALTAREAQGGNVKQTRIKWNAILLDDIIDMVALDRERAKAIKAARRRIAGLRLPDQIKKTAELNWAISLKDG